MAELPTGTVTFLFTDIEDSTTLAQQFPAELPALLARHHTILHEAIEAHYGHVFQIIGDSFHAAFPTAADALQAALDAQHGLQHEAWQPAPIKVRMGIHTGSAQAGAIEERAGGYVGYLTLTRAQRVMSVAHGGQVLLSNPTVELVRGELPADVTLRDMGEHRLKGLLNLEHLWQLVAPDVRQDFPPPQSLSEIPNNLPVQLTSFIGREKDIAEVKRLLSTTRLVTLTGSGGAGKTRLSLQVAGEMIEDFKHGIWFIELAALTDPVLVPQAVASVLGVHEEPGRPLTSALLDSLHLKHCMLILDNCEHLIEACAKLADALLHAASHLKILASSRQALGIAGEVAFRVPSLSLSPDKSSLADLQQCEAARLFVDRALAVQTNFAITPQNASVIAQICRCLDGIPLALELAAARTRAMSLDQIASRLNDRFRLLTGGSRMALPRHQTLRAALDWSFDLLASPERALLIRLSVFAGGWTLPAAEAIVGQGITYDVLDTLTSLIDKSLAVIEQEESDFRYRLLETVRQYAREKLNEADDTGETRDRHLDFFMRLAEEAETELIEANQVTWLKRLEDDLDNFRAALEWSLEDNRASTMADNLEKGLRLGSAIWRFCLRYGYVNELAEKLNRLLKHPQTATRTSACAKALRALSILVVWQNDLAKSRSLAEASLVIHQELGDQNGLAGSLYALGVAAWRLADPAALSILLQSLAAYRSTKNKTDICDVLIMIGEASKDSAQRQACLEEALALARERGDVITMAGALDRLGILASDLGNFSQARSWLEESLKIQRPLGAPGYVSTLLFLSEVTMYEGNWVEARASCEEALSMSKDAGMTLPILWSLSNLGDIALREGKWDESKATNVEVLRQYRSRGTTKGMIYSVENLASIAAHQNEPGRAARLFAFAATMRRAKNSPRHPPDQAIMDRDLTLVQTQLNNTAFEALWAEGRAMTLEQAVEYALEEDA